MLTEYSLRKYSMRRGVAVVWPGIKTRAMQLLIVMSLMGAMPVLLMSQPTIPPDKEALLKGLGSGLAIVADLNNYPGPKHVIDLKVELGLTRDQLKKTEALEKGVSSSAVAKGAEIVQAEEELFQLFEAGTVSEKALRTKLEQIGKLRSDLRFIHLQAHLRMKQILTPDQIKQYGEIRVREN